MNMLVTPKMLLALYVDGNIYLTAAMWVTITAGKVPSGSKVENSDFDFSTIHQLFHFIDVNFP